MSAHDDLFELRNYFYLGNLASATTEGETVSVQDAGARIERDVILKRLELAKGKYDAILQSIEDSSPPALQVLKLLALLLKEPSTAETAPAVLEGWLEDEVSAGSPCFILMCAILYTHLGDYDNALRMASRSDSLELMSVRVQVLLRMDRVDVAEKEVAAMQKVDEDATLTQLATAWTHLASGGERVQEAVYIYQDLLERHGATDQILNGIALCNLAQGKPEEAERTLQEALSKNPNCAATLVNVIVCSKYRNKQPELVTRYFDQLKKVAPSNPWLKEYGEKEQLFDELATRLVAA